MHPLSWRQHNAAMGARFDHSEGVIVTISLRAGASFQIVHFISYVPDLFVQNKPLRS